MRAILCAGAGGIETLSLGEAPRPAVQAGQVRIRVRASGLNRADIVQRKGHYPPPPGESELLGLEVAGEIAEGPNQGQRVMALLAGGGYAEEVCVDAGLVMPIPEGMSFAQGAAIPEVFLTAHHNLFTLGLATRDSTVLIHAGASGVGTAGIQLLRAIGARVLVTVGSEEKADAVRELGAEPILYKQESFAAGVKRLTEGRGVDVLLDPVGASHFDDGIASLATGARWVFIGTMGGTEVKLDIRKVMRLRAKLIGSTLRALPLAQKRQVVVRFREQFLAKFSSGELKPIVDKTYPASEVRAAHARMEANENIGKIILEW